MDRSLVLASLVFAAVLGVGVIDIVTYFRTEQVRADYARQMHSLEIYASTQHQILRDRLTLAEQQLDVLDGLARETYSSLKRHKGHALPAAERATPTPRFR